MTLLCRLEAGGGSQLRGTLLSLHSNAMTYARSRCDVRSWFISSCCWMTTALSASPSFPVNRSQENRCGVVCTRPCPASDASLRAFWSSVITACRIFIANAIDDSSPLPRRFRRSSSSTACRSSIEQACAWNAPRLCSTFNRFTNVLSAALGAVRGLTKHSYRTNSVIQNRNVLLSQRYKDAATTAHSIQSRCPRR